MTVADTDVLIDALHGREPAVARIAAQLKSGSLATTTISEFELLSGARDASLRTRIEQLLAAFTLLPFDEAAATAAASIRLELEAAGTPIGTADYLIAGICLARSATLLTRNRKHFLRVPGLLIAQTVVDPG